jgi:hypothetical protein
MGMLRVGPLPPDALTASVQFHATVLPRVLSELERGESVTLVFAPADHAHRAWRLAVVQGLARQYAPLRVNAVVSDDEQAITAAVRYLASAEGITGQLLPLDGNGAGEVLSLIE